MNRKKRIILRFWLIIIIILFLIDMFIIYHIEQENKLKIKAYNEFKLKHLDELKDKNKSIVFSNYCGYQIYDRRIPIICGRVISIKKEKEKWPLIIS